MEGCYTVGDSGRQNPPPVEIDYEGHGSCEGAGQGPGAGLFGITIEWYGLLINNFS